MPKVDMDMASGKIALWHVAEGARVKKGAPLFDIETDKAAMEVEAPADGVLAHRQAADGAEVPIGAVVAWLYAEGEEIGAAPVVTKEAVAEVVEAAPVAVPEMIETREGLRATPAARALAQAEGVALEAVPGTGPRGRVQRADVAAKVTQPTAPVGALHVSERGQAGAGLPLVFLHGFAADSGGWAGLEAALPGNPQRYRIDLPGHGRSPVMGAMGFPELVATVRHAFDALKLERAHLVGHSLGGAVALALADTRPRNVARLTLICPAGLGPQVDGTILRGLARSRRAESLAPWLRALVGDARLVTDAYLRAAQAGRQDVMQLEAQEAMAEALFPDGTQGFDLRPALSRLTCPTRLIWGRQDRLLPWAQALAAPGAVALHLFEGLGHMPHIEAPEEVAQVIA